MPRPQEQFFDRGLDFIDIVKSSVFMTGKIHVFVSCNGFHNCKQVACAHGDTFFGGSIAAVVAENPADQPVPKSISVRSSRVTSHRLFQQ